MKENAVNYFDKYYLLHDKPCIDSEPKSRNGWSYTFQDSVSNPITPARLANLFETLKKCNAHVTGTAPNRLPQKKLPLFSFDELIGISGIFGKSALRILCHPHKVKWQYCNADYFKPKSFYQINWIKVIKALYKLSKLDKSEQRKQLPNYPELFNVSFKIPLKVQYVVSVNLEIKPNLFQKVAFLGYVLTILRKTKNSMYLGFILNHFKDIKHDPIEVRVVRFFFKKKLNMPSLILAYFGTNEHPIYKNYKGDL